MKLPVFALLCALSVSACAQSKPADDKAAAPDAPKANAPAKPVDASKEAMVRAALKKIDPSLVPDRVGPSPMPGFQEAIVHGRVVYFSDDGRYMLQGLLFDIEKQKDLTQIGLSGLRRDELAKVPVTDRIVFAPVGPRKHTVTVFTDIECGFCRKMHSEMADYNKLGIAIEYLAFPRAGLTSADALAMESVWCSADRRQALTDAKSGVAVPPKRCTNPVAAQYKLGQRIGLEGTPMAINADGIALPGYLPPAKMLQALDELAAEKKAKPADSTAGGR